METLNLIRLIGLAQAAQAFLNPNIELHCQPGRPPGPVAFRTLPLRDIGLLKQKAANLKSERVE